MATILVVDDRAANRDFLVTLLGYSGHTLLEACDGAEALALAEAQRPDLIISDIIMPTMDGFAFVRHLRSRPAIAHTKVIFYTASDREPDARKLAEACGVREVLVKPVEPPEILRVVQKIMGEPLSLPAPMPTEEFEREHLVLLTNRLAKKMAELEALNAELEQRVRERTAELQAANNELEAFSYSVSHDLRAPLRAIDGFSRIVLDDFAPQLPPEAQSHLHLVRRNTQHMAALIDDLLAFARLNRQPLNKQPIAPRGLVRQCLEELRAEQESRKVEIALAELPVCRADRALLRQVFLNLLSNALKYTRRKEAAKIEIGGRKECGELVYYVKDNGAGFDMKYADKLFGVFQRLHRAEDYEGTGVGLGIVQRIVHRHGGRVWAEAEVDKGAAFYFALPEGNDDGQSDGNLRRRQSG